MRYTVFLGAPSPSSTLNEVDDGALYQWRTLPSTTNPASRDASIDPFSGYPSSALDGASRRISAIYENIIFADDGDEEGDTQMVEDELIGDEQGDRTTLITWAATTQPEDENDPGTRPVLRTSMISHTASIWQQNNPETQQDDDEPSANSYSHSYSHSNTSSIARFPDFQFSLSTLSALASARGKSCLLLAVLEVDGPDEVTVRRGPDAGRVVSVLRLIVGDEASTIRKLTAWRAVAEIWGGTAQEAAAASGGGERVRRGDVVHFENVLVAPSEDASPGNVPIPAITASPNLRSRAEICYRTMPRASVPVDMRLRPDLRLGTSDAAVRRVAAVVSWFERISGLASANE